MSKDISVAPAAITPAAQAKAQDVAPTATTQDQSQSTVPPIPQQSPSPSQAEALPTNTVASVSVTPAVTSDASKAEPRFKGATKQKVHNASIVLTELYSQLETLTQLENRAPSTRGAVLVHILQARDGLLQMQDLLKDD